MNLQHHVRSQVSTGRKLVYLYVIVSLWSRECYTCTFRYSKTIFLVHEFLSTVHKRPRRSRIVQSLTASRIFFSSRTVGAERVGCVAVRLYSWSSSGWSEWLKAYTVAAVVFSFQQCSARWSMSHSRALYATAAVNLHTEKYLRVPADNSYWSVLMLRSRTVHVWRSAHTF